MLICGGISTDCNSPTVNIRDVGLPACRSTYKSVTTPKPGVDGEPIRDSGVSLLIVKRQKGGAWKVALMMATRGEDPMAASQPT